MNPLRDSHRLGLGTYRLGVRTYEACRVALDLGYRHLDTAVLYENETAVAQAVADSGIDRATLFITTKLHVRDLRPGRVLPAARESLERLGRIDLLLLHAPVGDSMRAWAELQEAATWPGVGALGVSNFDIPHLERLEPPWPAWNQIEVTPFLPRRELVAWCQARQTIVAAHSPLTKGHRLDEPLLAELGAAHGASPSQILISWSLAKGFAVLPRSANPAHLAENLAATSLLLSAADLRRLDGLEDGFATHPRHAGPG